MMKNNTKTNNFEANELGTKQMCATCSTKYYDFGKSDASCPKCKATADIITGSPEAQVADRKPSRKRAHSPVAIEPSEDSSVNVDAEEMENSSELAEGDDSEDGPENE